MSRLECPTITHTTILKELATKMHGQTARHRRVSAELRQMREQANMSAAAVADSMGWNQTKVHRLERGEWKRLKESDLRRLASLYNVSDEHRVDALVSMAKQASLKGWWARYSDVLGNGAYVALESTASRIRFYGGMLVPGLLQTPNYARAVILGSGVTDEGEIDRRLEARLIRQNLVNQKSPLLEAIVDEAALRKSIGGRLTMEEQLIHLCVLNQNGSATIRLIPDSAGSHSGLGGQFAIIDFPDLQNQSVVFIDHTHNGLFLEEPEETEEYEMNYANLQANSLSPEASNEYIRDLIK